jgi:hypothetical protein
MSLQPKVGALVITGLSLADGDAPFFSNDRGAWNVAKALRDCAAGKHPGGLFVVAEALAANGNVEVDEQKVERYLRAPEVLEIPLILVMEEGEAWLIDGHHRLHALARLGVTDFTAFVIEEADAPQYRVLFNGERLPPFPLY